MQRYSRILTLAFVFSSWSISGERLKFGASTLADVRTGSLCRMACYARSELESALLCRSSGVPPV